MYHHNGTIYRDSLLNKKNCEFLNKKHHRLDLFKAFKAFKHPPTRRSVMSMPITRMGLIWSSFKRPVMILQPELKLLHVTTAAAAATTTTTTTTCKINYLNFCTKFEFHSGEDFPTTKHIKLGDGLAVWSV